MSYPHGQRKKTIKRFKKRYGKETWYCKFRAYVEELKKERLGVPITLEDAINAIKRGYGRYVER
jgi:hypothetical protein